MSYQYIDIKKLTELIKQHSISLMDGRKYVATKLIDEFLKISKNDGSKT